MQTRLDLYTRNLTLGQDKPLGTAVPVTGESNGSFGDTLTRALNEVSDARDRSSDLTKRFAAGENVELHQVMAAAEEASLSLELLVETRNKLTDAYRSIMNMQV